MTTVEASNRVCGETSTVKRSSARQGDRICLLEHSRDCSMPKVVQFAIATIIAALACGPHKTAAQLSEKQALTLAAAQKIVAAAKGGSRP